MPGPEEDLRELYAAFPYPSHAWSQLRRLAFLPARLRRSFLKVDYHGKIVGPTRARVPAPKRMLDAGCGTGEGTIAFARAYPATEILGLDANPASLERARAFASALGVSNVRFERADLMEPLPLTGSFDLVTSIGVIHHLRDPAVGLRQLAERLAPDGRIVLFLYGKLGRARHRAATELLGMLVPDPRDVATKVRLAAPLGLMPHRKRRPLRELRARLRGLERHWDNEAYVADSYANPLVHEYDVASLLELLAQADLELEEFFGQMPHHPEAVWSDPEVLRRVRALSPLEQLRAIELALHPSAYTFFARPRRASA